MKRLGLICSYAAVLILTQPLFAKTPQIPGKNPDFGNLPLTFEPNQGQADASIQFLSHGDGYALALRSGEITLALPSGKQPDAKKSPAQSSSLVSIKLWGADTHAFSTPEDLRITRSNYFLGSDPTKWHTDIPNYGRLRYHSVYPGIDLVYYGNQRHLENDFVIAPGARPSRISLQLRGVRALQIDPSTGDLLLDTGTNQLRLHKPVSYQQDGDHRIAVDSSYRLLADNRVGFQIGRYNHAQSLVIDPVLTYSTYLGGSGSGTNGDQGNGIAVDSAGNAYVVGTTYSTNFPVTAGALQAKNASALPGSDPTVFVSKFNAAGSALVYSTYLGGSSGDFGYGIALDSAQNAYITGSTYSTDFPITCGALQVTKLSTSTTTATAFVARLSPGGNGLVYSTYLGGAGDPSNAALGDVAQAIAVSNEGNAYITGYTYSHNFPTSENAYDTTFKGTASTPNAFITRLNSLGTALVYSTYLGSNGSHGAGDFGNAIALDSAGDAFIAGSTSSSSFPVTKGVFQPTKLSPAANFETISTAFVTEINPAGTDLVYSSFLGGSAADSAQAIALDTTGAAYVGGTTASTDFPVTSGVVEGSSFGANTIYLNGFAAKVTPDGSALDYSTHVEGHDTTVKAIAVDAAGSVYLAGIAAVPGAEAFGGFHATPDGLPTPASGTNSAFVVKLDSAATVLNYATLLGGSLNDGATGLAIDSAGNVYITGYANSTDFPVTTGAFQAKNATGSGSSNAFVSKLALGSETNQTAYLNLPSDLGTSIVINDQENDVGCFDVNLLVELTVVTNQPGPPLNGGTLSLDFDGEGYPAYTQVYGTWGSTSAGPITLSSANTGTGTDWSADFGGDPIYSPSSTGGTAPIVYTCVPPSTAGNHTATALAHSTRQTTPVAAQTKTHSFGQPWRPANSTTVAAKFTPPVAPQAVDIQSSINPHSMQAAANACINPVTLPVLNVTLDNAWKEYGATNPALHYVVTGLHNGDTVTVTPSTTATQTSPVGTYPITATVTGLSVTNYTVNLIDGTLTILKAPLYISAKNVAVTYGQTPSAINAYTITGFVNGDTASVISGSATLATTVTSTTPVGVYPITVGIGSLTAQNYYFDTFSDGEGSVEVYKAPLHIKPASATIHAGDALPAFTYTLSGFVNGDAQGSATTGAASLSTTAPVPTKVGNYYIIGAQGSLQAHNYYFLSYVTDYGILTVLP